MKNTKKFLSLVEEMEKLFIEEMSDEEASIVALTAKEIGFDMYRIKKWKMELKKETENIK